MRRQIFSAILILVVAVTLAGAATVTYNVVEDSGDGSAENRRAFVGDRSDGTLIETEWKIKPNADGTVTEIRLGTEGGAGSDYSFTVDIYAVQENPDDTHAEGTLIKDNYDPTFTTGFQTVTLDTTFDVQSGQNWTIEFVTSNSDGDGTTDVAHLQTDEDSGLTNWATRNDGVLQDWGGNITVVIEESTPTATATPAPSKAEEQSWYEAYVLAPNLYSDLVLKATVSEPIALLFAGIILGFAWVAVKLRSIILGGLWIFVLLSFVLAVLVDTSLVYFWLAVSLWGVGFGFALMESARI